MVSRKVSIMKQIHFTDIIAATLIALAAWFMHYIWLHGGEPAQPTPTEGEFHVTFCIIGTIMSLIGSGLLISNRDEG